MFYNHIKVKNEKPKILVIEQKSKLENYSNIYLLLKFYYNS